MAFKNTFKSHNEEVSILDRKERTHGGGGGGGGTSGSYKMEGKKNTEYVIYRIKNNFKYKDSPSQSGEAGGAVTGEPT